MSERDASTFRKGQFTNPHIKALTILAQNGIAYRAEEVIHIWGEYDGQGRPVSYKCDIVVDDPSFGPGVVEIEGEGTNSANDLRDHRLLSVGFHWVEHVPNKDAKNVMQYVERHRRASDL